MARKSSEKGVGLKRPKKGFVGEETPITISGGSIKVAFNQEFEEDKYGSDKTVRKVKHPNSKAELTQIIVTLGPLNNQGSNIVTQFPLNKLSHIYIKGKV